MKRFVIALSIAAMSVAAFAGPHRGPRQRQQQFRKMVAKLGLTDAQKQQLRDLRKANRERNHQLYADLHAKVREYRAMRRANDPKAEALRNEIQPLREQARAARKAAREQFRNVLTAEQRQQLDEMRAARKRRND